jgi:hypothetical protein
MRRHVETGILELFEALFKTGGVVASEFWPLPETSPIQRVQKTKMLVVDADSLL